MWQFVYLQKDEDVGFFREKFAGSQADRAVQAEAEAKRLAEHLKKTKISVPLNWSILLI